MLFDVLVQREFPQIPSDLLNVDVQHLGAGCTAPQRPGKMEERTKKKTKSSQQSKTNHLLGEERLNPSVQQN